MRIVLTRKELPESLRPYFRAIGHKPKDRIDVPHILVQLLRERGWWLRDEIVFHKPAPMPESVTSRCTQSWEPIFMLTKSAKYFFDAEAIKEPTPREVDPEIYRRMLQETGEAWYPRVSGDKRDDAPTKHGSKFPGIAPPGGRNCRNVWSIGPEPFTDTVLGADGKPVSHFAAFPSDLPRRCILAGTSAKGVCPKCGEPWRREVESEKHFESGSGRSGNAIGGKNGDRLQGGGDTLDIRKGPVITTRTVGWSPGCSCDAGDPIPATCLDPFAGTGTTLAVALELGRSSIGIELSEDYLTLARRRLAKVTAGIPGLA